MTVNQLSAPGHDTPREPDRSALPESDRSAIETQLGRPPRAVKSVAFRCPCGNPAVTETLPRLADGTPFPTTFYLTCPKASGAIGTLEASGLMKDMTERLVTDPDLAAHYRAAHECYLAHRKTLGDVPEIEGVSAGGMPTRVKCLHVHVAHSLAVGRGVNPFGDEARDAIGDWWSTGPCVSPATDASGPIDPEPAAQGRIAPEERPQQHTEPKGHNRVDPEAEK